MQSEGVMEGGVFYLPKGSPSKLTLVRGGESVPRKTYLPPGRRRQMQSRPQAKRRLEAQGGGAARTAGARRDTPGPPRRVMHAMRIP